MEDDVLKQDPEDIRDCRVEDIGLASFGECLLAGPNLCVYALPFGYAFLCRHPRLDEIMERSKKEKKAADG